MKSTNCKKLGLNCASKVKANRISLHSKDYEMLNIVLSRNTTNAVLILVTTLNYFILDSKFML